MKKWRCFSYHLVVAISQDSLTSSLLPPRVPGTRSLSTLAALRTLSTLVASRHFKQRTKCCRTDSCWQIVLVHRPSIGPCNSYVWQPSLGFFFPTFLACICMLHDLFLAAQRKCDCMYSVLNSYEFSILVSLFIYILYCFTFHNLSLCSFLSKIQNYKFADIRDLFFFLSCYICSSWFVTNITNPWHFDPLDLTTMLHTLNQYFRV